MFKKIKKRYFVVILVFLGLFSGVSYAMSAVQFVADVILDLPGITLGDIYIDGDNTPTVDSFNITGNVFNVIGIVNGNIFTLENSTDNIILRLTPSGGTADFSFSSANFSNGYINQWNTTSSVSVNYLVGVPLANTDYAVNRDGVPIAGSPFNSGALAQLSFGYTGAGTFTIEMPPPPPCEAHEIWGYAWSENIGWISFSCQNTMAIGTGINYGVDIDEVNGRLYGYAWAGGGINPDDSSSATIGWISFTNTDLVGCPSGTCAANINMTTGALSGWARALAPVGRPLSETGGWDGWIKLSGTGQDGNPYGPILISGSPSEFEGWAWGGDPNNDNNEAVIGFISFNSATGGGPFDYAVYTGLSVNNAPTAAISCTPVSCTIYHTEVLVLNNDSTDPDGVPPVGNITQSEWALRKPPAGYIVRPACVVTPILCNITPQNFPPVGLGLAGVGDYIARLIVTDAGGLSSTDTQNFSILRDAIAGFRCSLDNINWENCDTIIPIAGELVYFIDDQTVDPNEYSQASQGGSPIISREWRRDAVSFSAGNNTNPSVISLSPSMDITLTITDSAFPSARTDTRLHTIGSVVLDLPTWNEIAPF